MKMERIKVKRNMEERWEMVIWLTQYIVLNQERWERENMERDKTKRENKEEWQRALRLKM